MLILTSFLAALTWIGLRVAAFSYCCVWATWYQNISDFPTLT